MGTDRTLRLTWSTKTLVIPFGLAVFFGSSAVIVRAGVLAAWVQAMMLLAAALSFNAYASLPPSKKDNAAAVGRWAAILHLATTNSLAIAYAWFMFGGYEGSATALGDAMKDYMLGAGLVGSTLALFRSSGTHSYTQAVLRQSSMLETHLRDQRDILKDLVESKVPEVKVQNALSLFEIGLVARTASNPVRLTELATNMVWLAVRLPDTAEEINAISLWIRSDQAGVWGILAGEGISPDTAREFQQDVIEEEMRGAGIVTNMAATGTDVVIVADVSRHPWYKDDPHSSRHSGGLAAVLIRDRGGMPLGALCVTSQHPSVIPEQSDEEAYGALENTLLLWELAFSFVIERLVELSSEANGVA